MLLTALNRSPSPESAKWTGIVVDHYGLDINWEKQLVTGMRACNSQPRLLVIDDLADRVHQADLLLDQNFLAMKKINAMNS